MTTRRLLSLVFLLAVGCIQIPTATDRSAPRYHVKTDGSCMELKSVAPLTPDEFLRRFEEHWTAGRKASAFSLARRFPDVGATALRSRDQGQPETAAQQALKQCLGEWLQPVHEVRTALARADSDSRSAKAAAAEAAWLQVARGAARLGVRWQDPNLWEAIANQRPLPTSWPGEVSVALLPLVPESLHAGVRQPEFPVEAIVWHTIGQWRLQRGEASAALAAFGKAGSQGRVTSWDEYLHVEEARAWLALEQAPMAVSQLTALVERTDGAWCLPALALLGSAKLHAGHAQQALVFLQEAVEKNTTDFPGRGAAEADLGLAYLSLGQEAPGLAHLAAARRICTAARQHDLVLLSLENEIRYFEEIGDENRAQPLRAERDRLERGF